MKKNNKARNSRPWSRYHNSTTLSFMSITRLDRWVKVLLWLFSVTELRQDYFKLAVHIKNMYSKNGRDFTVTYLKEAYRLLTKVISGQPEPCASPLRVATRRGLPLILPGKIRLLIEGGDYLHTKLAGSILSVFRVIKASPKLKVSTIVDPFNGNSSVMPEWEVLAVFNKFKKLFGNLKIIETSHLLPLTTAGPNARISIRGAPADACALVGSPVEESWRVVSARFAPDLTDMLEKEMTFSHALNSVCHCLHERC
jgi:hypothetical protein